MFKEKDSKIGAKEMRPSTGIPGGPYDDRYSIPQQ